MIVKKVNRWAFAHLLFYLGFMRNMENSVESKVAGIIEGSLFNMGYEVVRVMIMQSGTTKILQIMIDRLDGKPITVDDCEKASRQISALMDVEDPVDGHYNLEVSSPGVDRPLTKLKHFEKYSGFEAKIDVEEKIEGQRKFRGKLQGVEGNIVYIESNVTSMEKRDEGKQKIGIDFNNIRSAKLVLTDELLEKLSVNL